MTEFLYGSTIFFTSIIFLFISITSATVNEENCEVCMKLVDRFYKGIPEDDRSSSDKIIDHFKAFCKKAKGKDDRFCYYVGGSDISATYIVKKLSEPLAMGFPINKVCERLRTADPQICDLKYPKKADLKTVKFSKMKVKELKRILEDWGEACVGCTEKSDFVKLIAEKMEIYDKEAWEHRKNNRVEL